MSQTQPQRLTKRLCDQISVDQRKELPDAAERRLRLRVTPAGHKSWSFLYYRPGDGSRARLNLGTYPATSLQEARLKAREARSKLDNGDDPGAMRYSREVVETFDRLADLYLERHARPNKKTAEKDERLLAREIRPHIGHLPVERVTRSDVLAVLDKLSARGALVQSQRVFETVRGVFRWGLAEDFITNDPTHGMKRRFKYTSRDRILSDTEVARLLAGIDQTSLDLRTRIALKLALATGQRIGEVCAAQLHEFDLLRKTWTIPGSRAKNAQTHELPLGSFALELIKAARERTAGEAYLFASRPRNSLERDNIEQPLMPSSATKAFRRVRDELGIGPAPATPHDFRRTFATFMQREGVLEPVVARLLNHRSDTARTVTSAVYMRHAFSDEKRAAMEMWDAHLRHLQTNAEPGGNLVPLQRTEQL